MSTRSKKDVEAIVSGMGVFMAFISNLVELVKKFGGSMENIYRLATPDGSKTLEKIARIIVEGVKKTENKFLKLISGSETIIIDECDGTETLADAKDVFAYIDSDFKNWGLDKKASATGKTPVQVFEMSEDATFRQMFNSFSTERKKLCLKQSQIKKFVKKHSKWLRTDGYATFFLFKKDETKDADDNFFVAYVHFYSGDKLEVNVNRFENDIVWSAEVRRRLVVPQLA
ncbi:MAG: hypothetical protein NTZ97_03620 [Candidatus Moranbacteria bacterium]|nr:hypothetical protein [Candidatus Moranbacteria bacterium]